MSRPYCIYVNGILARRRQTLRFAIKDAMQHFPSYVVDARNNAVVWKGE